MYTAWTKHLNDPKDKAEFERTVQGSKRVLGVLMDFLEDSEKSLDKSEMSPESFKNPNWAYLQAYKNGYRACLDSLKTMIDLDQQLNPDQEK